MREGCSLQDFDQPPFILVGSDDEHAARVVQSLYVDVAAPVVQTTVRTAEMVKYACNCFHAAKVTFANEIGSICKAMGALKPSARVATIFKFIEPSRTSGTLGSTISILNGVSFVTAAPNRSLY